MVKTLAGGAAGNSSGGAADDKKGNATAGADYTMGGKKHKKRYFVLVLRYKKHKFITLLEERVSIETTAQKALRWILLHPHSLNNYRHGFACYIERITTKKEERGQFGRLS